VIGLDTTVLVAYELREVAGHEGIRATVRRLSREGADSFALAPQVIHEFLHVTTDPRRFERPLSFREALSRAKFWWSSSDVTNCYPDSRSESLVLQWMDDFHLGRKRILDTALAATYHSFGVRRLATANPADFSVFEVFAFEDWAIVAA
jgi:predicted nucleic acid-binding protein